MLKWWRIRIRGKTAEFVKQFFKVSSRFITHLRLKVSPVKVVVSDNGHFKVDLIFLNWFNDVLNDLQAECFTLELTICPRSDFQASTLHTNPREAVSGHATLLKGGSKSTWTEQINQRGPSSQLKSNREANIKKIKQICSPKKDINEGEWDEAKPARAAHTAILLHLDHVWVTRAGLFTNIDLFPNGVSV